MTTGDNALAVAAFVVGIFSVVGLAILGPVAIFLAGRALRSLDADPTAPQESRGLAVAARVLGIIGTVILVLAVVAVVVLVVVVLGRGLADAARP